MQKRLYGDDNPVRRPEVREKISRTLKERWFKTSPCSRDFLEKIYTKKEYSMREIERIYGWHHAMISKWLKKLNIPARKQSYWHGKEEFRGNLGTNKYGSGFTKKIKEEIRERDGFTCQTCNLKETNRKHCVHHKDGNKKNNSAYNLTTLCIECHGRLHRKGEFRAELAMANP